VNDHGRIRVLTVDDHPLLQERVAAIINHQSDMRLVAQASSGTETIQKFREHGGTGSQWPHTGDGDRLTQGNHTFR
jgi:DNA-binding LytR/AlgR family response regulator